MKKVEIYFVKLNFAVSKVPPSFDFSRFPGILERGELSRPGKKFGNSRILAKSRFQKFPDFQSISIFEKWRTFSVSKVPSFDFSRFPGILERGDRILVKSRFLKFSDFQSISIFEVSVDLLKHLS